VDVAGFGRRKKSVRQIALVLVASVVAVGAQATGPDARTRRVNERMEALQREAQQLAGQSKTLLGDLRRLEIERDLRIEEARQAEAAATSAKQAAETVAARVEALEQQRAAQLPDLRTQLVEIYKRGQTGYASLLFGSRDVREFARATRAISSLSRINERRVGEHRATLAALRTERTTLEKDSAAVSAREQQAEQARAAAQKAVAAREALIARIDAQRDLTAQYMGELQATYQKLRQQLTPSATTRVDVPLVPFRGALEWPVAGQLVGRFGRTDRPGAAAARNGIEIAAADGSAVRAVHEGTVAFAGPFTGFGTLVIVDHGGNDFTLYGALGSVAVERGSVVEAGTEVGRSGTGAGTTSPIYFEVRIDGRSVDPLQWLKPR
jgi:septal ring factor EnvC (AmiA/AmiB activator)